MAPVAPTQGTAGGGPSCRPLTAATAAVDTGTVAATMAAPAVVAGPPAHGG
jgi:hypothetical protein